MNVKDVLEKLNLNSASLKSSILTMVGTTIVSLVVDKLFGEEIKLKEAEAERKKNAELADMIADVVINKMGDK